METRHHRSWLIHALAVRNDKFEAKETAQTSRMVHSSDGRLTAQMEADGATVYVAATGERAFKCQGGEGNQLQGAHLSPMGTFLITCSRHGQRKSATGGSMPLTWTHEGLQGGRRCVPSTHGQTDLRFYLLQEHYRTIDADIPHCGVSQE